MNETKISDGDFIKIVEISVFQNVDRRKFKKGGLFAAVWYNII